MGPSVRLSVFYYNCYSISEFRCTYSDMYGGLSEVLELVQSMLQEGSLYCDFKGREECRSFVLEISGWTSHEPYKMIYQFPFVLFSLFFLFFDVCLTNFQDRNKSLPYLQTRKLGHRHSSYSLIYPYHQSHAPQPYLSIKQVDGSIS